MAYVTGQPADNSKIRDFPLLVRNNFEAIEDGDSSFSQDYVNIKEVSAPSEVATFFRLYTATDNSETALLGQSYDGSGGNSIQFTENGFLGATGQTLRCTSLQFDTTAYADASLVANGQNALVTAWGRFTAAGATIAAYNCSSSSATGGRYTITFGSELNNANYLVVPSVRANGASYDSRSINVVPTGTITYSTTQFGVVIRTQGSSPSETTEEFGIVVYGGL